MIGRAAPPDRAATALDSVRKYLCTPYGHRICYPAYDEGYDPTVGTVTIFAPGYKENGAIFCHTNPWIMIAEALTGKGKLLFSKRHGIHIKARLGNGFKFTIICKYGHCLRRK